MTDPRILKWLPHRDPFLFLERIIDIDDAHLVAETTLTGSEPFFRGHYPDYPIMPGVLMVEAALQAGAALIASRVERGVDTRRAGVPILARLQDARFRHPARPGDVLRISAAIKQHLANAYYMSGEVRVGGVLAVKLEFTVATAELPK